MRPPSYIIGRTARPPRRVAPVTSTLGCTVRVAICRPLPPPHDRCSPGCASRNSLSRKCVEPSFAGKAGPGFRQFRCGLAQVQGLGHHARSGQARRVPSRGCGHILGMQRPSAPAVCFVHVGQAQHSSSGLRLWRFVALFGSLCHWAGTLRLHGPGGPNAGAT